MTDREVLFSYRLLEAEETLADAHKMLDSGLSPRSVVNRSYYAIFYAIQALFLHDDVEFTSSRHAGLISHFDKMYIHTNKMARDYSKILHRLLKSRQDADYRELVVYTAVDAADCVRMADIFLDAIKRYMISPSDEKDSPG